MPLILIFLVGLGVVFNAHAQPAPEGESGWRARTAVETRRDMVVAAHPLAVQAGVEMLAAGGSATDAAIAAQWVLGLVEPQSSGLGGGGGGSSLGRTSSTITGGFSISSCECFSRPIDTMMTSAT